MKLDPETREKAAQEAHAAANSTNWDLLSEGSRNVWRGVADAVAALIPEPTPAESPRPIDFADVRVGDRVRIITEGVVRDIGACGWVLAEGYTESWYLLDRPDPDSALIEVMAERAARADDAFHDDASHDGEWPAVFPGADAYRAIARAALAALRETHTIEPRPTGGDIHA